MTVTLGNFFTSNGRTVLGGLGGSGLDTEGLINALAEAKAAPKLKLEDKVELNNNKVTAYGELRTLLATLKDAANFLRNPPGVGNAADNVFRYRSATVSSNTSVAASTYMSVAVEPGTSVQTYNISEISSLARAKKQRTGAIAVADANTSVVTSAHTPGFFKAGTVAINGEDLTLEAGDTLAEVAAKFNEISDATGISASIIQADTNDFRLVFTATEAGTDADFSLNVGSSAVPTDTDGVFSMISRTNLLTNGTFTSGITSWTDASLGTGAISGSNGEMVLDGDGSGGNEAFAQQAMATTIGQQYTVRATFADLASSAFIRIGTNADVSNPNNFDVEDYEVLADGTVSFTFTATATTTYLTINSDTNTDPLTVDDISVVASATTAVTDSQTASDAEFVIDGVSIVRNTNSITDVVEGVTFNLVAETPALTELEVDIVADDELPNSGVINFINAFNALRIFSAEQGLTNDDGTFAEESYLATDSLLKSALSTLANELSRKVEGAGTFTSLSELGIAFTNLPETEENPLTRNILTVNEDQLNSALAESFDSVEALFGFSFTSSNSKFAIFSRTNALDADSFTISADPGTETFEAVVDGDTYELTADSLGASGYALRGQEGTPLEGLVIIYGDTVAGSTTITVTQGIADRIYNFLDGILDEQDGSLTVQVDSIESTTQRYEDEMARIDEQVEKFREQLLRKFGALESVIANVNSLLNSLEAQDAARNSGS